MNQNLLGLIEYPFKGILSKKLESGGNSDVTLFCMSEKTAIEEHTSTKAGLVYVIEGEGIFNLQETEIRMSAGVLIFMNKNAAHSLKALKNTSFLLILSE